MSFEIHFQLIEDYIQNSEPYIQSLQDQFMKTRFTGFLAVNAVTVYELCVKEALCEFGAKKHKVFGEFVQNKLDKMNGRIRPDDLIGLSGQFGEKYKVRFKAKLKEEEERTLATERASVREAYTNIITWRHKFAHQGEIPTGATYEEAKRNYFLGKKVVMCFAKSMQR